jgi:uncharacterized protein
MCMESLMKKCLLLALLILPTLGIAQRPDAPANCNCVQPNSITVNGEGIYEADPDVAVISMTISTQEAQLKDAYSRATNAAEQIRQVLRSNGIDPKEAQVGFFQVEPVYDYTKAKRKAVGYAVRSNITLKVKDFTKIAPLSDAFATIDVTGDQNVSYDIADMPAARDKAIQIATQNAHKSAEIVAATTGAKLGELLHATVGTMVNIQPMARTRMAMQAGAVAKEAPTAEFGAAKISVNANVTVEFAIH